MIRTFEEIEPSTNTTIVTSNIVITDLGKLFNFLPITEYKLAEKKRGRKSKADRSPDPNNLIPSGGIVAVQYEKALRGVVIKKKKKSPVTKANDFFRNSITIVMKIENKFINFKITKNGTFQITGTKTDKQRDDCITHIWDLIKGETFFSMKSDALEVIMIPAMRNINWKLDITVDRERMNEFINNNSPYSSILANNVNVKVPYKRDIRDMDLVKKRIYPSGEVVVSTIKYSEYLDTLAEREKLKKLTKLRNNTFLIFQTGVVIMSSINADFARDGYYEFMKFINENSGSFEEKIKTN